MERGGEEDLSALVAFLSSEKGLLGGGGAGREAIRVVVGDERRDATGEGATTTCCCCSSSSSSSSSKHDLSWGGGGGMDTGFNLGGERDEGMVEGGTGKRRTGGMSESSSEQESERKMRGWMANAD